MEGTVEVTALVGSDRGLARRALRALTDAAGIDLHTPDALFLDGRSARLEDAAGALMHPPWSQPRRLVILWDLPLVPATGDLSLLDQWASQPRSPGDGWLILWAPEADRRLRTVKELEQRGRVTRVDPMDARQATETLVELAGQEGGGIHRKAAAMVVQMVGTGFDALEQEIRKLLAFTQGAPVTEDDVALATTGTPGLSVFRLTESVAERRLAESLKVLGGLLDAGESAIGLLALLAREFRLLGRTKALLAASQPLTGLGLPSFVTGRLSRAAPKWEADEVRGAFRLLLEADRRLKTGGRPRLTLELLLVDLLGAAHTKTARPKGEPFHP